MIMLNFEDAVVTDLFGSLHGKLLAGSCACSQS